MNSTSVPFTWTCHLLSHHADSFAFRRTEGTFVIQSHLYSLIQVKIILWQYLNVYFIFYDLCECFILRCYAYEGMSFVTFVRDALYPEGIYRYGGRRTLTLNIFCVALFLILSIWEQVPNRGSYTSPHIRFLAIDHILGFMVETIFGQKSVSVSLQCHWKWSFMAIFDKNGGCVAIDHRPETRTPHPTYVSLP
jgi:hypothetical protein